MSQETTATAPATGAPHAISPEDRVPMSHKLAYGLGSFFDMWGHWLYPTIAFQIFGLYLGVPFHLIGIAVILNRLFDAISDPLFGWLSDNARTRWGRRRPFMFVGCILAAVFLPGLLAVSPGWSGMHYFVFMLVSSAIYLPIVSCFNMPYQSLGAELTPDYHERTSVFAIKNAVQKIPELGLFFFGRFFSMAVWVGADNSNVGERIRSLFTSADAWRSAPPGADYNMLLGAQVYLVMSGILMFVCGMLCVFTVKERYYQKLVAHRTDKVSIFETLWLTLKCRPFLIQKIMDLGYNLGLSMVGTLGLANTIYYVCQGDKSEGNFWNMLMGMSGMGLGLCGIPVFAAVAKRLGKRHAMLAVMSFAIIVFFASWWLYTPKIVWLQVLASGFIAFIGAGYWTIAGSIGADVMDYDELEGGRRREGSFAACSSWINKVFMAIGAGISFFILGWLGLVDNRPEVQTDQAGEYRVTVTDASGASVTSPAARVEVTAPAAVPSAPTIATQPSSAAVAEGQPAVLCVGVAGSGPFTYEWRKDGTVLPDQAHAQLVFEKAAAENQGSYTVTVTNGAGSATSAAATVTVRPAPAPGELAFVSTPASINAVAGQSVTLAAPATGTGKLTYRWTRDGEEVPGATGATLGLTTSKQPAHTIFMIRLLFAALPIAGLTFSLIALAKFPLSQEKMAEIRAALEARRGKV